jgi:hypothetical protein
MNDMHDQTDHLTCCKGLYLPDPHWVLHVHGCEGLRRQCCVRETMDDLGQPIDTRFQTGIGGQTRSACLD